jgi:regulation of enolase protein 1 (concanavalin A-like superfamily)
MTSAPVRKYYVVTVRGERGPVDRLEMKALLRDGEIQRSDRVRTATGRQLGSVVEFLADERSRDTADLGALVPPAALAAPPMRQVSGRQRSSPPSRPVPRAARPAKPSGIWIAVAVVAALVLAGVIWAMSGGAPPAAPQAVAPATQETPPSAVPDDGREHADASPAAVGGDPPDAHQHTGATLTLTAPDPVPVPAKAPSPAVVDSNDPATWTALDIGGDIAGKGPTKTPDGTWSMTAAGADVFDLHDQFRFACAAPVSGDVTITACVTAMQATHRFDKAGVMFRADNSPGAATLFVNVNHAGMMQDILRTFVGQKSTCPFSEDAPHPFPVWVRLSRHAGVCAAWTSNDGKAWQSRGALTVPALQGEILCGIALCSHQGGKLTTAVFDQIAITTP